MVQQIGWIERIYSQIRDASSKIPLGGRSRLVVVLAAPALVALIVASGWYVFGQTKREPYQVLSAERTSDNTPSQSSSSAQTTENKAKVVIDVSGAVVSPGVKELQHGARVNEALEAAGGFGAGADREYVLQVLNLAQLLEDGDKLYIPTEAQVIASMPTPVALLTKIDTSVSLLTKSSQPSKYTANPTPTISVEPSPALSPDEENESSMVNVNTAGESELDGLPGIGEATVLKIIQGRPYQSVDQLCSVINNSKTCAGLDGLISF